VRALIYLVAITVAVVAQVTVVDRIAFPGGAGPDLVLLVVAALALAGGPMAGVLTGFLAGLALDVAPPGSHFVGQDALVFCLIGYACGLAADTPSSDGVPEQEHAALFEIGVTALGAVCGEALAALLGVMLSDPRVSWRAITHVLPAAAGYDVVLCPFVLYAVAAAVRLVGARGGKRSAWSPSPAMTAAAGTAQPAVRPAGAGGTPRLRLSDRGKGDGWLGGAGGPGAGGKPAAKREPRLKLGQGGTLGRGGSMGRGGALGGSLNGGALGAAFAGGGAKVRFGGRRGGGVLGGSLLGGSLAGGSRLGASRLGRSRFGSSRLGRSLLGGSVFSHSAFRSSGAALGRTPLLGRPSTPGRSPFGRSWLGRSPLRGTSGHIRPSAGLTGSGGRAPRFARGSTLSRLSGALRRSAGPRSPGKGWLRQAAPRRGALGGRRPASLGRNSFGGNRLGGNGLGGGGLGGGGLGGGGLGGNRLGGGGLGGGKVPRLRGGPRGLARLRMPHSMSPMKPKRIKRPKGFSASKGLRTPKRRWRTGGYR
jgi:rod shape-determining protein MreD